VAGTAKKLTCARRARLDRFCGSERVLGLIVPVVIGRNLLRAASVPDVPAVGRFELVG
jgi:hypothetical protein